MHWLQLNILLLRGVFLNAKRNNDTSQSDIAIPVCTEEDLKVVSGTSVKGWAIHKMS